MLVDADLHPTRARRVTVAGPGRLAAAVTAWAVAPTVALTEAPLSGGTIAAVALVVAGAVVLALPRKETPMARTSCGCTRQSPCSDAHRLQWEMWLEGLAEQRAENEGWRR